jgi:mannose-1-phosphate guanylyltransferase
MTNNKFCVILAGGIGLRLWPASRQSKPKQFIDILGKGETLLQATYKRVSKMVDRENILISTNEQYKDLVLLQLPQITEQNILLEPVRKNTLPSATWATVEIIHRNPNATVLVVPSDQYIDNEDVFHDDVNKAFSYVEKENRILSLGIMPNSPETNYGYIQMDEPNGVNIYKVRTFLEKPEEKFAKMFVENHEFLWNTGIFLWNAKTFLNYVQNRWLQFEDIFGTKDVENLDQRKKNEIVKDVFAVCPNLTIENVCLEHNGITDVMQCRFGWFDIGSWLTVYKAMPKNEQQNVVMTDNAMLYDCCKCLVKTSKDKLVVIQGLDDFLVVEDNNTLVICKKNDEKSIRKFVNDVMLNIGEQYI